MDATEDQVGEVVNGFWGFFVALAKEQLVDFFVLVFEALDFKRWVQLSAV